MKVLQVHNLYRNPGGEDRVVETEAALLREAGHEVVVHHAENPTGALASARALVQAPWNRSAARQLRESVERHSPDVVHVHNTWFSLTPAIFPALRASGVPVVMTLHNFRLLCANAELFRDGRPCEDCVGTAPWRAVQHGCYHGSRTASVPAAATISIGRRTKAWHDHVDQFLAPTSFVRERYIAGGLPPERISVKAHSAFDPGPRTVPPSRSNMILYVGRLSEEKGVESLLRAFNEVGPAAGLELSLVGDGPLLQRLQELAGPGVHFEGWLPRHEVAKRMLTSRFLTFPSLLYETFGLVMAEALAAGLPVLGADHGVAPSVVGGAAGIFLPPGDVDRWRATLSDWPGPALDAASVAARVRWEAALSPSVAVRSLLDAYNSAIDGRTVQTQCTPSSQ